MSSDAILASIAPDVIDELPIGVVVVDRDGYVLAYNRYEEELARRSRRDVIGRHFFNDVARCTNIPSIAGAFAQGIADDSLDVTIEHVFGLPFMPVHRDVDIRLRSFTAGAQVYGVILIQDITMRKQMARDRDRLLHIFMHDLNNPLTAIIGFCELIADRRLPPGKETADAMRLIDQSARQMHAMVTSTLNEARGRSVVPTEIINLGALVLSSLGRILPRTKERGLVLSFEGEFQRARFPERAVPVRGRVDAIARALDNLLTNAVKYARTRVDVQIDEDIDEVAVVVSDDGPGIAEEFRERVFDEGFQPPGSKPGHGLGLYSVRRTAIDHSGRVSLSCPPNGGTAVRLVFPTARVETP